MLQWHQKVMQQDFGDNEVAYHVSFASPTRAIKGSGQSSKNVEFVEICYNR